MAQPAAQPKSWIDTFLSRIGDQLEDLTHVDVMTATAQSITAKIDPQKDVFDELSKPGYRILARTTVELDGDIIMMLPTDPSDPTGGGVKIIKDVMDIHKENTTMAVNNYNNFLNMIVNLVNTLVTFTGLSSSQLLEKFSLKPPPT